MVGFSIFEFFRKNPKKGKSEIYENHGFQGVIAPWTMMANTTTSGE